MKDILLTDEELLVDNLPMEEVNYEYGKAVAQAQLKKMVNWGGFYCSHDNGQGQIKQWACPVCRIELKKIAGVEW